MDHLRTHRQALKPLVNGAKAIAYWRKFGTRPASALEVGASVVVEFALRGIERMHYVDRRPLQPAHLSGHPLAWSLVSDDRPRRALGVRRGSVVKRRSQPLVA